MGRLHLEGGATPDPRVEVVMYSLATLTRFSLPRQLSPARRSARLLGQRCVRCRVAGCSSVQAEHARRRNCTRSNFGCVLLSSNHEHGTEFLECASGTYESKAGSGVIPRSL
jgi:hypothetical protein